MKSKVTRASTLARLLSLSSLPLLSLGLVSQAFAQDSDTNTDETQSDQVFELDAFVVRGGYAGSLAEAAQKKQMAPVVIEVVAAEDIGKLPDTSIAESLARLPGVATQRVNGRAQIVSIRGLNEDFVGATLNGREQVSTGSVRAIEFDQYPSEVLTGAVVYKTGDASIVAGGIGGVVDLRSARPLDYRERKIVTSGYYEWTEFDALNAGSERDGYRYNLSYIDQFDDDKWGIAFGYAYTDKPGQGKQWNSWGYPNVSTDVDASEPNVIGGAKPFIRSSTLKRHGLLGTIEYQPNDRVRSSVDVYYTNFKEDQLLRGIEFPLYWGGLNPEPGFTVENGLITEGVFDGVKGVMRNDIATSESDIISVGWNLKVDEVLGWDLEFDLSHSYIDREGTVLETYSGTGTAGQGATDTLGFRLMGDTGAVFSPSIDYTDRSMIVLTSPQGWGSDVVPGGQLGYLKTPTSEDKLTQIKLVGKRDINLLGFLNTAEWGANLTSREKFDKEQGYYLAGADGATELPLPENTGVSDLSFIGVPGQISYDPIAVLNSGVYERIENPNADVQAGDWNVEEDVTTLYGKLGLDTTLFGMPLTGSIGTQFVYATQTSTGTAADGVGDDVVSMPVEGTSSYWDFVPSLNLVYQIGESRYLRFSAARQLSRQRMDDMRAGIDFGFNPALANSTDVTESPWSGEGGNPELEPWRSNSLDLSLEQYFADNMGYVAITGYYKKLLNYTYNLNTLKDFTGFPTEGVDPVLHEGYVSKPVNGPGGEIKGVEATLSLPFELFSDTLTGFGVVLSGSWTDSTVRQDLDNPATPMPGLSEEVWTATLYYERAGFSARVSTRYRSEYLANVDTFGPRGRTFRTINDETVVDAQVGYDFADGSMLEGLGIFVQGYNLTNEPLSSYSNGDSRQVIDYQEYGASYAVGASYSF
ncbi:MAG: TonB-dependent receptor [Puniceicoccaceae bacterium 5H]|nr:MAG: TonB-dependent receptor [Puniceicoccaceae bacterium 5H]